MSSGDLNQGWCVLEQPHPSPTPTRRYFPLSIQKFFYCQYTYFGLLRAIVLQASFTFSV